MTEHKKIEPDPRGQVIAKVELKKIGNSSGVILPKEVMAQTQPERRRQILRHPHTRGRSSPNAV